jgi:hypothetical protein
MRNMNQEQIRTAVNLLTEVACCTIEVHNEVTEDVRVCEATVGYLAKDDPTLANDFKKTTAIVLQDKDSDYTMKQYDGKSDDLRRAIRLLETLANATDAPAEEKEMLTKAARLLVDFYDVEVRGSAYFLTEQACCLTQAQGKDSKDAELCKQALRLITKDDPAQMQAFTARTSATKHNPDADYDTEQYEGKETDIRHAVTDIMGFAGTPDIPAGQKEVLKQAAEMIASFYGMDEELLKAA